MTETTTLARRTAEDIAELKRQWLADPCWDIEETEGFEAHKDELCAWRKEEDRKAEEREQHRLIKRSIELGVPGATGLVLALEKITRRLTDLEQRLADVGDNTDRALERLGRDARSLRGDLHRTTSDLEYDIDRARRNR